MSANNLQDYIDCPHRFKLRYILKQFWPSEPVDLSHEFEENIRRGQRFHQMAYQFLSGIPKDQILALDMDSTLRVWFSAFLDLVETLPIKKKYTEETLVASFKGKRLQARYDLLYADGNGSLTIIDWKTTRVKPDKNTLRNRLQTILYPFILAESACALFTELNNPTYKITMRYWYANHPKKNVEFLYDENLHIQHSNYLSEIISEILSTKSDNFSKTDDKKRCKYCTYRTLCERGNTAGALNDEVDEESLFNDFSLDFDNFSDFQLDL